MTNCSARYATEEDVRRWFQGRYPPYSLRGVVLEIEGKIEALAGVRLVRGEAVCFSSLNAEARRHKRAIIEGINLVRKMLGDYQCVVAYAAKDEPTADAFIRHVGFEHVGSSADGEVYLWVA